MTSIAIVTGNQVNLIISSVLIYATDTIQLNIYSAL